MILTPTRLDVSFVDNLMRTWLNGSGGGLQIRSM